MAEPKPGRRTFHVGLPARPRRRPWAAGIHTEQTVVSAINSEEAVLHLRSKVGPGAKVRLSLHVPRTFMLEKPLDLNLYRNPCARSRPASGERGRSRPSASGSTDVSGSSASI